MTHNNKHKYPQQVYSDVDKEHIIGIIYPPRAGPLHTNVQFPVKDEQTARSFTVLYSKPPYMRKF